MGKNRNKIMYFPFLGKFYFSFPNFFNLFPGFWEIPKIYFPVFGKYQKSISQFLGNIKNKKILFPISQFFKGLNLFPSFWEISKLKKILFPISQFF